MGVPGKVSRVPLKSRAVVPPAIFVVGIAAGCGLWPFLSLPFWNPDGVVGPLADLRFNPANNILRYLVMLATPVALLAVAWKFALVRPVPRARPEKGSAGVPSPARCWPALVAIVLGSVILAVNTPPAQAPHRANFFHEGESLGPAVSYLDGKRPYRDFVFIHGLVQDPLRSVVAFKLLGRSIAAARTLDSMLRVLAFVLLGAFLWSLFRTTPLWAFVGLTILGLAACFRGGYGTIAPRDVTSLLYLLLVVWALESLGGGPWWRLWTSAAAAAGVAVSSFAYSVDRGYYLCAMVIVCAVVVALHRSRPSGRAAFLLASAIGGGTGVGVLWLLFEGELDAFARFTFVELPAFKDLLDGFAYPIRRPYFLGAVVLIAGLVFWAAWTVLSSSEGRAWSALRRTATAHSIELLLVAMAVIFFRSALGRADGIHVRYSVWPAVLALWVIVARSHGGRIRARVGTRPARWKRAGLAGLGSAYLLLVLAIPLRGQFEGHFPLGRTDESYLTPTHKEVMATLQDLLAPQEPLVVLNNEALWYYLLDRPSPSRYPTVWLAGTRAGDEALEGELRRGGVRVALDSRGRLAEIDGYGLDRRTPRAARYVDAHFELRRQVDNYRILVRRAE